MADEAGVVREMIVVIENRKKHSQINTLIKILYLFGYTLSIVKINRDNDYICILDIAKAKSDKSRAADVKCISE